MGKGHRLGGDWPGYLQQSIGNWQVNGIVTVQSGLPITPVLGFDNSNTGNFYDRPDTVGNPNDGPKKVTQWFNTSAFALPAPFTFGNTARIYRWTRNQNRRFLIVQEFRVQRIEITAISR